MSAQSKKGVHERRVQQQKSQIAFSRPAPSCELQKDGELLGTAGTLAEAASRGGFEGHRSLSPRSAMKSQQTLPRQLQLDGEKYQSAAPHTESRPYLRSGKVPVKSSGGRNSHDPATGGLRDFEAMVQTFAEAHFNDVGKQNIGYMATDEKQLVHHGAHSMPRQQVLARASGHRSAFGHTGSSTYTTGLPAPARDDEQRLQSRSALAQFGHTRGD